MKYALATLLALAGLSAAPVLAATSVTIAIPVTLSNIDRGYDSFQINCQMQAPPTTLTGPLATANMDVYVGKLVNRAFTGTASVTYSGDPAFAARATQAVCGLALISTTNPGIDYRVNVDDLTGKIPAQYRPKPGAPLASIITVKL